MNGFSSDERSLICRTWGSGTMGLQHSRCVNGFISDELGLVYSGWGGHHDDIWCRLMILDMLEQGLSFILGKGYAEPIAYEGALKIKEMCYIHAEGYSGGALKHGPFALIEGDTNGMLGNGATPVFLVILDDEHAANMRTAAEEVKARGAKVYIITDNPKLALGIDSNPIVIPSNGPLTALIAVLPLQLIAYELAVLRGINPDVPRNLAKAVTTD